jgi:hypothetical protein
MLKVGTRPSHAETLADNLTMADYRGMYDICLISLLKNLFVFIRSL